MDLIQNILIEFELHNPEGIQKIFNLGLDPNTVFNGRPLVYELITMYTRSSRFRDCILVFVENGLQFEDEVLLTILVDDSDKLNLLLNNQPELIHKKYSLDCTYTQLIHASLLHLCAEYNHVKCAEVLIKHGMDINVTAGMDEYGLGGQTPVFHTTNSNNNNSKLMLDLLLHHNCNLDTEVKGLIWGKGFDWETLIPAVNPISYAMMGLLPQMHRSELQINDIVRTLMLKRFGINYPLKNIPNKYLI